MDIREQLKEIKKEQASFEYEGIRLFFKQPSTKQIIDLQKKHDDNSLIAEYAIACILELAVEEETGKKIFTKADYDLVADLPMEFIMGAFEVIQGLMTDKKKQKK